MFGVRKKASFISMTMIHVRPVSDIRRNSSQYLMDDKGLLVTDVKTEGYSHLQHHRWYSRTKNDISGPSYFTAAVMEQTIP